MSNITIIEAKRTIEITKAFAQKSAKYGSPEYLELREARHDFPNFKVVTKVSKSNNGATKGITFAYMKSYIEKHDDEDHSIMKVFEELRGKSGDAESAMAPSLTYGEIKAWFFEQFPEIEDFHKERSARMDAIKKARADKREAEKRESMKRSA